MVGVEVSEWEQMSSGLATTSDTAEVQSSAGNAVQPSFVSIKAPEQLSNSEKLDSPPKSQYGTDVDDDEAPEGSEPHEKK